jgi:hypothetical protein
MPWVRCAVGFYIGGTSESYAALWASVIQMGCQAFEYGSQSVSPLLRIVMSLNMRSELRLFLPIILALLFAAAISFSASAAELGVFQEVETETLDEEDFDFPNDLRAKSLNIVMLAMSKEQDNGTEQGDALVEWYAALEEQGLLTDDVMAWHFSVMKVPFFVKGLIRGGMADSYEGKLPLDQAGAIFIKDIEGFAASAGIELDGQPSIVLVSADGELLELFKGDVSEDRVAAIVAAVNEYLSPTPLAVPEPAATPNSTLAPTPAQSHDAVPVAATSKSAAAEVADEKTALVSGSNVVAAEAAALDEGKAPCSGVAEIVAADSQ